MKRNEKRNDTDYALLGLILMEPRSGYDIKKMAETALAHFWNESYGNIYPILKRLCDDGLARKSESKTSKGPRRFVYSATAKGKREFDRWYREPVRPVSPKNVFLMKLFFGGLSTPETVAGLIEQYGEQTRGMREFLGKTLTAVRSSRSGDKNLDYWEMTMSCGLESMDALIGWCDKSAKRLRKKNR